MGKIGFADFCNIRINRFSKYKGLSISKIVGFIDFYDNRAIDVGTIFDYLTMHYVTCLFLF